MVATKGHLVSNSDKEIKDGEFGRGWPFGISRSRS